MFIYSEFKKYMKYKEKTMKGSGQLKIVPTVTRVFLKTSDKTETM